MQKFLRILAGAACLSVFLTPSEAQVASLPTAQAALVGRVVNGPLDLLLAVSLSGFQQNFGSTNAANIPAEVQAREFFANGGTTLSSSAFATAARCSIRSLNALAPVNDLRVLLVPELSLLSSILAKTDANYGVWKSPAGQDFPLQASGLHPTLARLRARCSTALD